MEYLLILQRSVSGAKAVLKRIYAKLASDGPITALLLAFVVFIFQGLAFLAPAFSWLPGTNDAESWLKTLWQVHASILGVTVIVVTIIVTVIANEKDRNRTWKLYAQKAKFLQIIWFNLFAVVSEGLAVLQTYRTQIPLIASDKLSNLLLTEGVLFVVSIVMAIWLFTVTLRFLDDDYVEDLAERRIKKAMLGAVKRDIQRMRTLAAHLQSKSDGS